MAVDGEKYQVIPNALNRYLLNKQSALQFNPDGSLTLAFAPKLPAGIAAKPTGCRRRKASATT